MTEPMHALRCDIPIRIRWLGRPTQATLDGLENAIARQVAKRVAEVERATQPAARSLPWRSSAGGGSLLDLPASLGGQAVLPTPAPAFGVREPFAESDGAGQGIGVPASGAVYLPVAVGTPPDNDPAPPPASAFEPDLLAVPASSQPAPVTTASAPVLSPVSPSSVPSTTSAPAQPPSSPSPAASQPSAVPAAPAPPPVPPVPVVPDPVVIVPVPAGTAKVSGLPGERFGRLAEVAAFAQALASVYASRATDTDVVEKLRDVQARRIRRMAEAEPPRPGEGKDQRRTRIDKEARDARLSVSKPARGDALALAGLHQQHHEQVLEDLAENWLQHVQAKSTQALLAHELANVWMVNRNQELLFQVEPKRRPAGSMDLWTHYRVMTPAEEATTPAGVALPVVDPSTVVGGPSSSTQLVTVRAAEFLTELHSRFPNERWTTRKGHGSGPFKDRGLSVDLYVGPGGGFGKTLPLPGLGKETFWLREHMVELFHALEDTAVATSFRFFAIYNDFSVARAANEFLTRGNVAFTGEIDSGGGLNYHGGGAKLHVHLDLVPEELVVLPPPPPAPKKRTK